MKKPTIIKPQYEAPRAETLRLAAEGVVLSASAGFGDAGDNGNDFGDIINPVW